MSSNRECCDPRCLTCFGTNSTQCNSCHPGTHLFTYYCSCDEACASCNGATSSNCLTCNTALGYKPNQSNSANCLLCHSSCKTCYQPNNKYECGSCDLPLQLSPQKNCYFECPIGNYKTLPIDPLTETCNSCHQSCQMCVGPGASDCTRCPVGALITPLPATVYTDWGQISAALTQKGSCTVPCSNG